MSRRALHTKQLEAYRGTVVADVLKAMTVNNVTVEFWTGGDGVQRWWLQYRGRPQDDVRGEGRDEFLKAIGLTSWAET